MDQKTLHEQLGQVKKALTSAKAVREQFIAIYGVGSKKVAEQCAHCAKLDRLSQHLENQISDEVNRRKSNLEMFDRLQRQSAEVVPFPVSFDHSPEAA